MQASWLLTQNSLIMHTRPNGSHLLAAFLMSVIYGQLLDTSSLSDVFGDTSLNDDVSLTCRLPRSGSASCPISSPASGAVTPTQGSIV